LTPFSVNSPLWGETPSKEGGVGETGEGSRFEVRGSWFSDLRTQNLEPQIAPVALGVPVSRLFVRCFSTRCTGILGSPRKRNFAKDGVPVPGHKPIQQIAEGLDQWKTQEG